MSNEFRDDSAGSGYDTPVPELDDHRGQIPTIRSDRPRRGTFDSLYAAAQLDEVGEGSLGRTNSRAVEDAISDDDQDHPPVSPRSRRPTFDSVFAADRVPSPPNSVKAFAEARRRDRGMSISEDKVDSASIRSANSCHSKRSFISKRHTIHETDAESIASTAEEDVCFPVAEEHNSGALYVDYELLDNLIATQTREEELAAMDRDACAAAFPDLVQQRTKEAFQPAMVTADGDFVGIPNVTSEEVANNSDTRSIKSHKSAKSTRSTKSSMSSKSRRERRLPVTDPNRFSFFSSAWESTAHAPTLGGLLFGGEDTRHLFSFPKGEPDGVWWLNVSNPGEEEARTICKAFGIHPLTIEDIITEEAREKIELFPSYYFASFRSFNIITEANGEIEYVPFSVYVVVFREGTLSFSYAPNGHAAGVRKRISMLKDYVALSSDWVCYALIDHIIDSFAPVIDNLENEIEQIEDDVFIARPEDSNAFLISMARARKQVNSLGRLLNGKADVLRGFTKRCNPDYSVTPRLDIGLYLGDIQDHIVTMHHSLQHFEKILSRTHSNYLGHLTIESIANGTKVNNILSKITLLGSIIVPLNFVCGLFGMNVKVPWQDTGNTTAFFSILGTLLAVTLFVTLSLRKMKWL